MPDRISYIAQLRRLSLRLLLSFSACALVGVAAAVVRQRHFTPGLAPVAASAAGGSEAGVAEVDLGRSASRTAWMRHMGSMDPQSRDRFLHSEEARAVLESEEGGGLLWSYCAQGSEDQRMSALEEVAQLVFSSRLPSQVKNSLMLDAASGAFSSGLCSLSRAASTLSTVGGEAGRIVLSSFLTLSEQPLAETFSTGAKLTAGTSWKLSPCELAKMAAQTCSIGDDGAAASKFLRFGVPKDCAHALRIEYLQRLALEAPHGVAGFIFDAAQDGAAACGGAAVRSGLPPEVLAECVKGLDARRKAEFLSGAADELVMATPSVCYDFTMHFAISELPKESADKLLGRLLDGGSLDAKEWLAGCSQEELLERLRMGQFRSGGNHAAQNALALLLDRNAVPASKEKAGIVMGLLGQSAGASDLQTCIATAQRFPAELRDRAAQAALGGYFETHSSRQSILSDIDAVPPNMRDAARRAAAHGFVFQNWAEAAAYAAECPDPAFAQQLWTSVAAHERWDIPASTRINAGLALISTKADSHPIERAFSGVIEHYGELSPLSVRDAIQKVPEPDLQAKLQVKLARKWAKSDAPAASEWIASMPAGKARDAAAAELVGATRDIPDIALANTAAISDGALRMETLAALARDWSQARGADFTASLLQSSSLSPKEISEALKAAQKPK